MKEKSKAGSNGVWSVVGINHPLKRDKCTEWGIKPLKPCKSDLLLGCRIGIATKSIVKTGHTNTSGDFVYGFEFDSNGYWYNQTKANYYGPKWALNDVIQTKYENDLLSLSIND